VVSLDVAKNNDRGLVCRPAGPAPHPLSDRQPRHGTAMSAPPGDSIAES